MLTRDTFDEGEESPTPSLFLQKTLRNSSIFCYLYVTVLRQLGSKDMARHAALLAVQLIALRNRFFRGWNGWVAGWCWEHGC